MAIASKELRTKAVEAYKTGKFTQQQLADSYVFHYKTILYCLKADANGEGQEPKKRGCPPRIFTKDDEDKIIIIIQDNPSITLEGIKAMLNKDCSISAVHRTLHRLGLTYKKNSAGFRARSARCQKST